MIIRNNEVYKAIQSRGSDIFMLPHPTYPYNSIILGCHVNTPSGYSKTMYAVAPNTWRGFHKIDKAGPKPGNIFKDYFIRNRNSIISNLRVVSTSSELDALEDDICRDLRSYLSNVRQNMLASYNKLRKPIDLYIEHIVAMAVELDEYRDNLAKLLFLPLDSQMFQSIHLFTDYELYKYGVNRNSTFREVTSKNQYNGLQELLSAKADTIYKESGQPFFRIYFDLLWNDRYCKEGTNLFTTNL